MMKSGRYAIIIACIAVGLVCLLSWTWLVKSEGRQKGANRKDARVSIADKRSVWPGTNMPGAMETGLTSVPKALAAPRTLYRRDIDFVTVVDQKIAEGVKRIAGELVLTEGDKKYLLTAIRKVLENRFSAGAKEMTEVDFPGAPTNLVSQSERLYVTLLVNSKVRGCQSSSEGNLLQNAIRALYMAIGDKRFGGTFKAEELSATRLDVTIFLKPISICTHDIKEIEKHVELGIHGISLKRGDKGAFFKGSVPVSHGYSLKKTLEKLGIKAKIGKQAYQKAGTEIRTYNTVQFAERIEDKSLVELYRSNLLVLQADVTKANQRKALRLCGEYMKNHVATNGLMTYEYDACRDKISNPTNVSSVIRRLAATWMLASLANYFNEPVYRDKARQSSEYFLGKYFVYDAEQDFGYLKVGADANLAMAAFMLLGLTEAGDKAFHAREKEQLLRFIFAMENKDKGFLYPVYLPDKLTNVAQKEIYYPGEALTAVMRCYEATGDKRCLALAERVFDYYRTLYERTSENYNMTPWLSKAYAKMFAVTGEKKYADFVFKMNDSLLGRQRDINQEYVDSIGCFFSRGASYSTAVMVEGVVEAYQTAKAVGDVERMETYRRSVLMGNRFVMQCQFTEDNMFTVNNRTLTLGGVRTFVYSSNIRIDSVQHAACALQRTLEYMY